MRIATKVSLITAIILILIISVLSGNATMSVNKMISLLEENDEKSQEIGLANELETKFEALQVSIVPIIHNEQVLAAFAQRDREALANLTLPMMKDLDALGIKQFHFHLPNATSFFRVQKPEEFGDDLSSFRQTVVQANNEKTVVQGLEGGASGAGFRYVMPLSYNNEHIGTVELGFGLEEGFLAKMKEDYNGEWSLFSIEDGKAAFMLSTLGEKQATISDAELVKLQNGTPVFSLIDETKVSYFPLKDFSREVKWFLQSEEDYSAILAEENSSLRNILIFGAIMSIIGLAIIIWLLRRILHPIHILSEHVKQIAQGNLTVEPPSIQSKDEIGALSENFHKMVLNLKSLIFNIQQNANELAQNADIIHVNLTESKEGTNEIVQSIVTINKDAQQSKHASEETAKAMSEIAQGIVRVADNTSSIANSSNVMNDITAKGSTAVQSAVGQMDVIDERTSQFATIIAELKVDSTEIGSIMQLITGIAEQTNLLALNAAIEAARAGEAGKGFAVVADEIRKLADQTTSSASKVHSLISEIQSKTETAVQAMDESRSEVKEGTSLIHNVGSMFAEIQTAIQELTVDIDELSALSEEMSAGTEQVTAAMQEIATATVHSAEASNNVAAASEQQLAGIEEIAHSAQTLSAMSKELEENIRTFKV